MTNESIQFHDVAIILNIEPNFHTYHSAYRAAGGCVNPDTVDVNGLMTVRCHIRKRFFWQSSCKST
jgi:hypothetical protein